MIVSALLPVVVTACDILGVEKKCATYAVPAVSVVLMDSVSNGPVLSGSAIVIATSGTYSDTARVNIEPRNYNLGIPVAFERPGTYKVDVLVTNYFPWSIQNIRVDKTSDGCHVSTRQLTVRLRPAG